MISDCSVKSSYEFFYSRILRVAVSLLLVSLDNNSREGEREREREREKEKEREREREREKREIRHEFSSEALKGKQRFS